MGLEKSKFQVLVRNLDIFLSILREKRAEIAEIRLRLNQSRKKLNGLTDQHVKEIRELRRRQRHEESVLLDSVDLGEKELAKKKLRLKEWFDRERVKVRKYAVIASNIFLSPKKQINRAFERLK